MAERQHNGKLSIREYIGSLLPKEPKRDQGDNRPLSLGEYARVLPLLNINDLANLGRGAKRLLGKLGGKR